MKATPMTRTEQKAAPRILIVEDEWLIAEDFGDVLSHEGYEIVGPANTAEEARHLIERETFSAALLDVNLTGGTSFDLADRLADKGVPYAYITGYDIEDLPERVKDRPMLHKPVRDGALPALVARLLGLD